MTLVNVRAALEKAVTDEVLAVNPKVKMIYDNISYTTPGKTVKYITMTVNFAQATLQNQGDSSDYYLGVAQCNIYVPKGNGTADLSSIGESVINGFTSVNSSTYVDTFKCSPKTRDIVGPSVLEIEDRSHFVGVISCQFTASV